MTALESIIFLGGHATASVLTHTSEGRVPIREVMALDEFAAAVATHTSADVSVIDGFVLPEDLSGTILVGDHTVVSWLLAEGGTVAALSAHVVRLFVTRVSALELLELSRLAGAIDLATFNDWRNDPKSAASSRLYGVRSIATAIGAECSFSSENYCLLTHSSAPGLPGLFAAYLECYADSDYDLCR